MCLLLQCPDKQCQKDIIAYLERIQLYCHQLKITSAVKADLKTSIRETVSQQEHYRLLQLLYI